MKRKFKYFIHPSFIEKQSILVSIKYLIKKYDKKLQYKKLLDVGCGSKPYAPLFKKINVTYESIDFKEYSRHPSFELPDFYFNKNYKKDFKLSQFKNNSYDIITAFQVLEHHEKCEVFFSEANRILKKGGYLMVSFPFIWELHEEPNDFQRLTHYKIEKLCIKNNFKILESIKRGSLLSTLSQLTNTALISTKIPKTIKIVIYLIFFLLPFQYFAYMCDFVFRNPERKVFLGYTILIKKV